MKYAYKILLVLAFLMVQNEVFAQTQFFKKVWVVVSEPKDSTMKELVTADEYNLANGYVIWEKMTKTGSDSLIIPAGFTLTQERSKTLKGTVYKVSSDSNYTTESFIEYPVKKGQSIPARVDPGEYQANISVSKDSLKVNFWLPKVPVDGKMIPYYNATPEQRKAVQIHPDRTYFMKLRNREAVSFRYENVEIAAMTLPFKLYPGFSSNSIDVDSKLTSDVNISLFGGKRIGRVRYAYDKYDGMQQSEFSGTFGVVAGLSSIKVDSASSSTATIPLTSEQTVATLSVGAGGVINIRDFNLGIFIGTDIGLGDSARKWNYDKKLWVGFGFGYNIPFLKKKD